MRAFAAIAIQIYFLAGSLQFRVQLFNHCVMQHVLQTIFFSSTDLNGCQCQEAPRVHEATGDVASLTHQIDCCFILF